MASRARRRKRNEALVELRSSGILVDALRDLGLSKSSAQAIAISYPDGRGLENVPVAALRELGVTAPQAKRVRAAFSVVRVCDQACDARVWGTPLRSPEAVVNLFREKIGRQEQEYFAVVLLDAKFKVTDVLGTAVGTLAQVDVHPRDIFREAVRRNAHSVIVAHNHPSGSPEPSDADVELTRRLIASGKLVGIPVLDSLVVTRNSFVSMAQRGMLEGTMRNPRRSGGPIRLTGRGLRWRLRAMNGAPPDAVVRVWKRGWLGPSSDDYWIIFRNGKIVDVIPEYAKDFDTRIKRQGFDPVGFADTLELELSKQQLQKILEGRHPQLWSGLKKQLKENPIEEMPGGSVSGCIAQQKRKPKSKRPSDPGAYCAAIADRIEPGWRSTRKKNPDLGKFVRQKVLARWRAPKMGGLADGMTADQFDVRSLERGAKVEFEHTSDPELALRIAMDHLVEDPCYYAKLAKMEGEENHRVRRLATRLSNGGTR